MSLSSSLDVRPLDLAGKSRAADARDGIVELIHLNKLRPDSRLPSEDELSVLLGVSRGTIRHALTILEEQGIVERRHGSGTFVSPIDTRSFDDLVEYRILLETNAGLSVIARGINKPELEQWISLLHRAESEEHPLEFAKLQFEFHAFLLDMGGNRFIATQYRQLIRRMDMLFAFGSAVKPLSLDTDEHLKIVDEVTSRNGNGFVRSIKHHILTAADLVKAQWDKQR